MAKAWFRPSKLPFGALMLFCRRALRTSSRLSPSEAMAEVLIRTRTAGFCLPWMVTNPTPGTSLNFWASTVSATSVTRSSGSVSECACRVRMGESAGLILL